MRDRFDAYGQLPTVARGERCAWGALDPLVMVTGLCAESTPATTNRA